MDKSTVVPQAYTREVLAKAFNWLQHQSISIKSLATSPDVLVNLYLKSQRHPMDCNNNYDHSSSNFKKELQSIADGLENFDKSSESDKAYDKSDDKASDKSINRQFDLQALDKCNEYQESDINFSLSPSQTQQSSMSSSRRTSMRQSQQLPWGGSQRRNLSSLLDQRSQLMIRQVKDNLNLGSEGEAIRLLIAIGFSRLQPLFDFDTF